MWTRKFRASVIGVLVCIYVYVTVAELRSKVTVDQSMTQKTEKKRESIHFTPGIHMCLTVSHADITG